LADHRLQLLPGEKALVDIRPHWSFLTGPLIASVAAIAVGVTLDFAIPHTSVALHWVEGLVVAVPCLWLTGRVVRWRTTSLILTSHRLVERSGVWSRRQAETPLAHIAAVTVVQTLGRRIVGTGRLELEFRDDEEIRWIDDVRKPVIVQRVIHRRLQPYPEPGAAFG
jgi:Bacterial PH domain